MTISVLIVDDDAGFRRVAAELLGTRGYSVLAAASRVDEAFELVKATEPDAVLLDVNLEDGDGISLAARLSVEPDAPRVLLTSTDAGAAPPRLVAECGAAGFVAKPDLADADVDRYFKR
jgi:CheY-like chemotaxis protein